MRSYNKKSYFLNIQFILGLFLLIAFIIGVFLFDVVKKPVKAIEGHTPFTAPLYSSLNFGTDALGRDVFRILIKSVLSDAFVMLVSWLLSLILSISLGYVSSKQKWIGSGLKEILGFGPSLIIAAVLIYLFKMGIYGVALAVGIGLTPYLIAKYSDAFESNSLPMIYYYSIHGLFISALTVEMCGYLGLFQGYFHSIGDEIHRNISYTLNYPNLVIPYAIASVFLILFPSLMIRGIKNAYANNVEFDSIAIEVKSKYIEKTETDKTETSLHKPVISDGPIIETKDEKTKIIEEITKNVFEEKIIEECDMKIDEKKHINYENTDIYGYFTNCKTLDDAEKAITEFLVFSYDYSYATLYEVTSNEIKIKSIHRKTTPPDEIDIKKENDEINSMPYKRDFLLTISEKEEPFFVYPGKDKYDRIFHQLSINKTITHIVEASFNKTVKNENDEIQKLKRFVPYAETVLEKIKNSETKKSEAITENKFYITKTETEKISDENKFNEKINLTNDYTGLKPIVVVEKDKNLEKEYLPYSAAKKEKKKQEIEELDYDIEIDFENFDNLKDSDDTKKDETQSDYQTETNELDNFAEEVIEPQKNNYPPISEEDENIFIPRYEEKLNKGLKYIREMEYNKAVIYLKESIALNPESSITYMALAQIYDIKELYEEALDYYRLALKYDKFSSNAYNYIGNILYKTGKYNLALDAWQKAYNIDPQRKIIKKNIEKLKKVIDKTA